MNDIVKRKRKRFILIILIVIASSLILCVLFGIVDYFRATSGKKPIFIYHTVNVSNFDSEVGIVGNFILPSKEDVKNVGLGSDVIVFEDIVLPSKEGSTYYGIGYSVSSCDNETGNYVFKLGHKQKESCFTSLTCTKTFTENDKQSYDYLFFDDKLYRIDTTITIPADQIVDEEVYKKELMEINDVKGCGVTFQKQNDTTYVITQMCNISNMSNSDVEKVYSASKKSMEQTKTEVIDSYSQDKDMICK
ncbi:MAG: hypothetical protein PHP12_05745 [Bacilli bacterium]|nr:hypothetical protein [Bacilli bacterium]